MSTRSRIALQNNDGTFTSIYCHFDGYPSNNGKILLEHYTDESKVRALMDLGYLSILGTEIGDKHDFDTHTSNDRTDCLAYGRDRGDKNAKSDTSKTRAELTTLTDNCGGEFLYLFANGAWSFKSLPYGEKPTKFRKLTQEACQE